MTDERSLAETVADTSVDATMHPTPEDFDIDSWLAGVRPTRRSIKLYANSHLIARLDEIADQIDRTPADTPVDDLIEDFEQTKAQFQMGVWFTVEKWSAERIEKFREDTRQALKLPKPKKGEFHDAVLLQQVAEQIVTPTITPAQLEALKEKNSGEFNKLLNLVVVVNERLAEQSGVLGRDFSQRRSAATAG